MRRRGWVYEWLNYDSTHFYVILMSWRFFKCFKIFSEISMNFNVFYHVLLRYFKTLQFSMILFSKFYNLKKFYDFPKILCFWFFLNSKILCFLKKISKNFQILCFFKKFYVFLIRCFFKILCFKNTELFSKYFPPSFKMFTFRWNFFIVKTWHIRKPHKTKYMKEATQKADL